MKLKTHMDCFPLPRCTTLEFAFDKNKICKVKVYILPANMSAGIIEFFEHFFHKELGWVIFDHSIGQGL